MFFYRLTFGYYGLAKSFWIYGAILALYFGVGLIFISSHLINGGMLIPIILYILGAVLSLHYAISVCYSVEVGQDGTWGIWSGWAIVLSVFVVAGQVLYIAYCYTSHIKCFHWLF
jgi:hypothetical protein